MSYPCLVGSADFEATDAVARHVETALQRQIGPILGDTARGVIGVIQPRPLESFDEERLHCAPWFGGIVTGSDKPVMPEPERPKPPIRLPVLAETDEIQLRRVMVSHDLASEDGATHLAEAVRQAIREVLQAHPAALVAAEPSVSIHNPFKDADPDRYIPVKAGYRA